MMLGRVCVCFAGSSPPILGRERAVVGGENRWCGVGLSWRLLLLAPTVGFDVASKFHCPTEQILLGYFWDILLYQGEGRTSPQVRPPPGQTKR